eukprot:TRINITY_DN14733_c0_g1_i1.p1 TRINITY_DN14733_c0_g1~~TRINITY_DN14733_c0_g1_i1.p1  ORF type:complete len:479 (-),score=67.30 TRINITY_DN14733_c0_g1_i1:43-1479(-)
MAFRDAQAEMTAFERLQSARLTVESVIREIRTGYGVPAGLPIAIVVHMDETNVLRPEIHAYSKLLGRLAWIQRAAPVDTFFIFVSSGVDLDFMLQTISTTSDVKTEGVNVPLLRDSHLLSIVKNLLERCAYPVEKLPHHVHRLVRFCGGNPRFLALALVLLCNPTVQPVAPAEVGMLGFSKTRFIDWVTSEKLAISNVNWLHHVANGVCTALVNMQQFGNSLDIVQRTLTVYLLGDEVGLAERVTDTCSATWRQVVDCGLANLVDANHQPGRACVLPALFTLVGLLRLFERDTVLLILPTLVLDFSTAQNERLDLEVICCKLRLLRQLGVQTVKLSQLAPAIAARADVTFKVPTEVTVIENEHRVTSAAAFDRIVDGNERAGTAFRTGDTIMTTVSADAFDDAWIFLEQAESHGTGPLWYIGIQRMTGSQRLQEEDVLVEVQKITQRLPERFAERRCLVFPVLGAQIEQSVSTLPCHG